MIYTRRFLFLCVYIWIENPTTDINWGTSIYSSIDSFSAQKETIMTNSNTCDMFCIKRSRSDDVWEPTAKCFPNFFFMLIMVYNCLLYVTDDVNYKMKVINIQVLNSLNNYVNLICAKNIIFSGKFVISNNQSPFSSVYFYTWLISFDITYKHVKASNPFRLNFKSYIKFWFIGV